MGDETGSSRSDDHREPHVETGAHGNIGKTDTD